MGMGRSEEAATEGHGHEDSMLGRLFEGHV